MFWSRKDTLSSSDPKLRCQAIEALASSPNAKSAESVVAALADEVPSVRNAARQVIKRFPPEIAATPLLTLTSHASYHTRAMVLEQLSEWRHPAAFEPLITALIDDNAYVSGTAEEGLTRFDRGLVESRALQLIGSAEPAQRAAGARLLGAIRCVARYGSVVGLLKDGERGVRSAAASALVALGDTDALEPLSAAAALDDPDIYAYPIGELLRLRLRDEPPFVQSAFQPFFEAGTTVERDEKAEAPLVAIGRSAVGFLSLMMKYWRVTHGNFLARVMGKIRDPRSVDPLLELLPHALNWRGGNPCSQQVVEALLVMPRETHARRGAIRCLATFMDGAEGQLAAAYLSKFDDPQATQALFIGLDNANDRVQRESVSGLRDRCEDRVAAVLRAKLEQADAALKRALQSALDRQEIDRKFHSQVVDGLARAESRASAMATLRTRRDPWAVEAIAQFVSSDKCVAEALDLLAQIQTSESIQVLAKAVEDSRPAVQLAAARALATIPDAPGVKPLIARLLGGRAELQEAVACGLAGVGDRHGREVLSRVLADRHVPPGDRQFAALFAALRIGLPDGLEYARAMLQNSSHSWSVWSKLQVILPTCAKYLSADDLVKLAALPDGVHEEEYNLGDDDARWQTRIVNLDCSPLRDIAKQEIHVRSLINADYVLECACGKRHRITQEACGRRATCRPCGKSFLVP